jgi:hypothetical protein
MNSKNNGLWMMLAAVVLAILALSSNLLVWLFWLAVIGIFGYGLYIFLKSRPN